MQSLPQSGPSGERLFCIQYEAYGVLLHNFCLYTCEGAPENIHLLET